jgi:hypothetical protein
VRDEGNSFCVANLFDGRGELLEEGGPRVNTEGNASLIEIETHEMDPQIVLIFREYAEETECVFDIDFREET